VSGVASAMTGSVRALVVLGRQGAGKGVQCEALVERFGLCHIATGDLLRTAMAEESTLGILARPFVEAGELVPDDLLVPLVVEELRHAGEAGQPALLDGFPRNRAQLDLLDDLLDDDGALLGVLLTVPRHVAVERMLGRGRADDTPAVIERRLELYDEETRPLLDRLSRQGRLVTVDGTGDPAVVAARLANVVAPGICPEVASV
jgi:adenylate kinase